MKKAKRTNNINKAIRQATKYDFTYKGFAIDHEEKMIWVLEATDIAIRNGNEELMMKFFEMIVERTQTGKAVARQDPNFKDGRPKKFTPEQIDLALSLLEQGKTYHQITTMTGISKSTLIRAKRVS